MTTETFTTAQLIAEAANTTNEYTTLTRAAQIFTVAHLDINAAIGFAKTTLEQAYDTTSRRQAQKVLRILKSAKKNA